VARQLASKLKGQTIRGLRIYDYRLNNLKRAALTGSKITSVRREGKQVCVDFGENNGVLLIHLRMTGRLIWIPHRGNVESVAPFFHRFNIADSHVRIRFEFPKGVLLFVDPRRFGTANFCKELPAFKYVDPLSSNFTVETLTRLCHHRKQALKQFLLRQDLIVGIGNIYASEILFRARLNPWLSAHKLKKDQLRRLYREIRNVLNAAIKLNGTTFSDFQDSDGSSGGFGRFLKVYARDGKPCRRCRTAIVRSTTGGRSTFYCIRCQPRRG
jgi:formamidopyrimidine-DNA glycosylase